MEKTMDAAERIRELEAQVAALRKANAGKLTMKVSAKGAASLYGMGKWPVTLYASQWRKLLEHADTITAFLDANAHALVNKDGTYQGETRLPSGAIAGEPEQHDEQ